MMADQGVWLVPTNYIYRDFLEQVEAGEVRRRALRSKTWSPAAAT